MKCSDTRYEEVERLNTLLSYLKNGGNHYSSIGVERYMLEQVDVDEAIKKVERELYLIINSNIG